MDEMSWVDTTPDEYELSIWITINECNILLEYFIIGSVSLFIHVNETRKDIFFLNMRKNYHFRANYDADEIMRLY